MCMYAFNTFPLSTIMYEIEKEDYIVYQGKDLNTLNQDYYNFENTLKFRILKRH